MKAQLKFCIEYRAIVSSFEERRLFKNYWKYVKNPRAWGLIFCSPLKITSISIYPCFYLGEPRLFLSSTILRNVSILCIGQFFSHRFMIDIYDLNEQNKKHSNNNKIIATLFLYHIVICFHYPLWFFSSFICISFIQNHPNNLK